jgi:hypothetical protein
VRGPAGAAPGRPGALPRLAHDDSCRGAAGIDRAGPSCATKPASRHDGLRRRPGDGGGRTVDLRSLSRRPGLHRVRPSAGRTMDLSAAARWARLRRRGRLGRVARLAYLAHAHPPPRTRSGDPARQAWQGPGVGRRARSVESRRKDGFPRFAGPRRHRLDLEATDRRRRLATAWKSSGMAARRQATCVKLYSRPTRAFNDASRSLAPSP